MKTFLKSNTCYYILFILLIVGALFLRFYNYENRWRLAYDQAHDATLARYALEQGKIPLLGPFSSAGPFQTGGQWYWIVMVGTAAFPFWVNGAWIFMTFLYVLFVILIILFANKLLGKTFGLIVGLLATVSTAQIMQSTNLTNQSPQALCSLGALWAMYRYVKHKNFYSLFFLGFFVSLASVIHLQGVTLFLLIAFTLLFAGLPQFKGFLYLGFGIFLPLIPLILYDISHDFFNSRNAIAYVFFNENKISYEQLGRRWLTYIGDFWPKSWAFILGGSIWLSYILIPLIFLTVLASVLKRKLSKEWVILFSSLLSMILLLRYIRTPLFDSYLVFLHPFILLAVGWFIYVVFKKQVFIGLLILFIIVGATLFRSLQEITSAKNYMAIEANYWKNLIVDTYPDKKFAMYDQEHRSSMYSYPLVLYLYSAGKIDDKGYKVSFGSPPDTEKIYHSLIKGNKMRFEFWDLNSSTSAQLTKIKFAPINPSYVYSSTEEWYNKK